MATVEENLTREEAAGRARLLSDLHYDVHLDLTGDDQTFRSHTTARFRCAEPGAETFIDCTAVEIHRIVLNGRDLDPAAADPTRIRLLGLEGENELEIDATMEYLHEGRGLHHFRDPSDDRVYLHSQFEPFDAHVVYACFDQPDLKATFDISVEAPEEWVVVSNMAARTRPEEGAAGRWEFETTPLVSPYITAVVAGPYASARTTHEGIDLGLYCRRSLAEHLEADEVFELTRQGLDYFADVFALPYPFGKYDQLFVPEFNAGAMENPGCITFSETFLFRSKVTDAARERRAEVILHEMAHMWFGDLVTMRWWDDLWLNESFATFMSVLAQVTATRFDGGWVTFLDSEKAWAKFQDQLPSTHPVADEMPDVESVHQNFDGITYAKGASVLRQLVAWVGQDAFLEGCRRYFKDHAWSNTELADFLSALEGASGRDLAAWRDEWLLTTGLNTFSLETGDDPDAISDAAVIQSADPDHPTLRRHRLAIGLYDRTNGAIVRRERIELDVQGDHTAVPQLDGVRRPDLILVNDDDLTYGKIVLDAVSTDTVTDHLRDVEDPLARALVWSAAWDMVRDAQLPARRFVDLVIANAEHESEIGVVQRMQSRCMGAVDRYGDPSNRRDLRVRLADHARGALERAEAGSDHQLAWARFWAAMASTDAQLDEVRRVLDGDHTIEGLEVDTELRWHLLHQLAAAGAAHEDRISAELERDQTDLGERHAASARAVRPDAAAKAEAWSRLTTEEALSHTVARELFGGFTLFGQAELLAPYADKYFDAVPKVWDRRSLDWALEFVNGTFPHPAASDDLLARVDAFLDGDRPKPMRRALLEQRDTLVRTLQARERDAAAAE